MKCLTILNQERIVKSFRMSGFPRADIEYSNFGLKKEGRRQKFCSLP
ncbi:hypothetical protein [Okeania sp. KiyG1]|nr:hypothetical protein [Okeania sp. KiyG1]